MSERARWATWIVMCLLGGNMLMTGVHLIDAGTIAGGLLLTLSGLGLCVVAPTPTRILRWIRSW